MSESNATIKYALIKAKGKQFVVRPGKAIILDRIDLEVGQAVRFDEVLLISHLAVEGVDREAADSLGNPSDSVIPPTLVGDPLIVNAQVTGTVLRHFRDKKVLHLKKRRRRRYKRFGGHRQERTEVQIQEIVQA
jgi:large subunit ribosomal protein L21